MSSLFENFFPGSRVQIDFARKGNEDYLVLCCQMSGFMQVYNCRNKSTEEALLKLRKWSANVEEECLKLGVKVEHSSAYNPSSQSAVEISIGNLKHLLKRTSHMNQLQL